MRAKLTKNLVCATNAILLVVSLAVQEQFLNHIDKHRLCQLSDRVLLAVSGGLDSMVMLHLFYTSGFNIGVAHVNFNLRGNESDGDAAFVKDFCSNHSIPFHTTTFDTTDYAERNKLSIQMAARELRYAWFYEIMEENGYAILATAHHLNDSIETVLLNWIHGSSMDGLVGIPVKNDKVIRPLLFATRDAIQQFATDQGISWRNDSSNDSVDYQRNLLRHKVIPELKQINPSIEFTVQRGFDKLSGEKEFFDRAFEDWKSKFVNYSQNRMNIDKQGFGDLQHSASILWRLIKPLGFNFDVCVNAIQALHHQSGKKFLTPTHQLVVDREHLIVFPLEEFSKEVLIESRQQFARLGSWGLHIDFAKPGKSGNRYEAILDADKLTFPLRWRQWKAGDIFYPLGMKHRKKVSDLLIDEKISLAEKAIVTVLESQGEIIWVIGHRIDDRFKITEQTQKALNFLVTPHFV